LPHNFRSHSGALRSYRSIACMQRNDGFASMTCLLGRLMECFVAAVHSTIVLPAVKAPDAALIVLTQRARRRRHGTSHMTGSWSLRVRLRVATTSHADVQRADWTVERGRLRLADLAYARAARSARSQCFRMHGGRRGSWPSARRDRGDCGRWRTRSSAASRGRLESSCGRTSIQRSRGSC
jgi:hypothetical protein